MVNSDAKNHSPDKGYWDFFIGECERQKAPLYARLARGIRDDPELRALAAGVRAGQPMANLILGAVNYLLLRGADHTLRGFYRTHNAGDISGAAGDPFPLFRDFCRAHASEIAGIVARRVTNTNEVGRSAYLRAGFLTIAAADGEPLHIIEIGPSAGLNLHWARYGYRYIAGSTIHTGGDPNAGLTLDTVLDGTGLPPLEPTPKIASMMGIERDPVDLGDADERDWLKALVWPDHWERYRRLELALHATRNFSTEIRKGDALTLLPEVLAGTCRKEGTIIVCHTMVTYQFPRAERQALDDILTLAGLRKPIYRLAMEYAGNEYPLTLERFAGGAHETRTLALCDPQGGRMAWLI